MKYKIILGIDPGLNILGFSILKFNKKKKKIKILKLKELNLIKKKNYKKKLFLIFKYIFFLIKKYKPYIIIIENFFLGKNVISLKRLIQCQSIFLFISFLKKIKIIKYYPSTVKYIITGKGDSTKKEIKKKIEKLFKKKINFRKNFDIIDSISLVLCYIFLNFN
ncbi:MAG: crossover junction endodeoxyribonuclease RuvC [Candidatus Shikimatogenerans sp. JK-2022]|nr:crossover junction endodeoxyribonuclease RuvC [Candidatus Shikimatogenerans bostrichidophilus]